MSSRDKILGAVKENQPDFRELPSLPEGMVFEQSSAKFVSVLEAIGGATYTVSGFDRIASILREQHHDARRIVSGCPELASLAETATHYDDPHTLENIDLAILRAHFGVAENGACWITEDLMIERALPFIAQHLALVIRKKDIVANMHEAYERIAAAEASGTVYGFATFIAGPSKTADIEQSLVLGAHGPRSMTVFLLDEEMSDAGFF
ncbi:MAG TPA: LUD domain-containing protein [Puia sp.]|jgi:L-lactate dehydrogenase complex protein LldG